MNICIYLCGQKQPDFKADESRLYARTLSAPRLNCCAAIYLLVPSQLAYCWFSGNKEDFQATGLQNRLALMPPLPSFSKQRHSDARAVPVGKNVFRACWKQNKHSLYHNEQLVGKKVEVLVEGPSKTDPSVFTGRTRGNKTVNFTGENISIGTLKEVEITEARTWSLLGRS